MVRLGVSQRQRSGGGPLDSDRQRRLGALAELGVLDRVGDPVLTRLTRLACLATGASAAAVHVFDDRYQRRVAAAGVPLIDQPASGSPCWAVVVSDARLVVSDTTTDPRFRPSGEQGAPPRFYASVPIHVMSGVPIGTVCAFDERVLQLTDQQIAGLEDVAALVRAHLELARLAAELGDAATLDALTGAVNRVIFDDRLAQALARRKRHGTEVLVAVIDLDRFKELNDAYGHDRGDAALRWVAAGLRESLRSEDTVGRLGGDEFGVVAETTSTDLGGLIRQVRQTAQGFDPPLTLSVGAVLVEDADSAETVLRRADQAMYAAKRAGRSSGAHGNAKEKNGETRT